MSFLIISIVVNCFVLIASVQDEASAVASADSFASAVANSSAPLSGESKGRTADKVYNSCGTACPLTCAQPKPRNCIKICKADYFCPQGYYENSQGKCVLLEDCDSAPTPVDSTPSESKPNTVEKVYKECGSPCRLTCGKAAPDSCIAVCESGLFCPDGYYENSANKCVLPEYCDSAPTTTEPPRHLPGHIVYRPPTAEKVYSECGSTCPLKCSSPKPQICNALCRPGFACPKGYYENSDDKCVLPEYCDSAPTTTEPPRHLPGHIVGRPRPQPRPFPINDPSPSWPNEFKPRIVGKVYSDCGSACPRKCGQSEKRACPLICIRGFSCPSDYYENSLGQCVLLEDCDSGSNPPQHLPGHIVGRPRPRPRPGNFGGVPDFPNFPNFQQFNSTEAEFPKVTLPLGPPRPRPIFRFDPITYNSTAVAAGAPVPPPAVVRTTGSNAPYIGLSMVPKVKPLIDLDPTVLRPATRVSQEQSSDADN